MAENKDGQEKTEAASGKRLSEARDKGQIAKSIDATSSALLLFGGIIVYSFGHEMMDGMFRFLRTLFMQASSIPLTETNVPGYYQELILFVGVLLVPVLLLFFVIALGAEIAQVGFHVSMKKFTDPSNVGRMFKVFPNLKNMLLSTRTIVELLKGMGKILVIGTVVYNVLHDKVERLVELIALPFHEIAIFMADLSFELVYKVGIAYILIGLADFFWQKFKYKRDMMMTKQETKEEAKQSEGDMQAKMRMRAIGRDRLRKLMLQRVKEADVVITNPTHYAIALQYKPGMMDAPLVVAKGVDHLALKIRELATKANIPIVEDKPLAQALYKMVEVDESIPESLFRAVAQVLAYVYKLKGRKQAA